jgi:hypothetical protein
MADTGDTGDGGVPDRDAGSIWCQVVVPDYISVQLDIFPFLSDGVMRIFHCTQYEDGSEVCNEVIRADIEDFQLATGAINSSALLSGYDRSDRTSVGKPLIIHKVSYSANNNGARQVRAKFDPRIRIKDVVYFDNNVMTVGRIYQNVGTSEATMELVESENG